MSNQPVPCCPPLVREPLGETRPRRSPTCSRRWPIRCGCGVVADRRARGRRGVRLELTRVRVDPATISHHLRVLREAGLIDSERRGTWVYYGSCPAAFGERQRRCCGERRARIRIIPLGRRSVDGFAARSIAGPSTTRGRCSKPRARSGSRATWTSISRFQRVVNAGEVFALRPQDRLGSGASTRWKRC